MPRAPCRNIARKSCGAERGNTERPTCPENQSVQRGEPKERSISTPSPSRTQGARCREGVRFGIAQARKQGKPQAVVDLEAPVAQIPGQRVVLVQEIVEGLAQSAMGSRGGWRYTPKPPGPTAEITVLTTSVCSSRRSSPAGSRTGSTTGNLSPTTSRSSRRSARRGGTSPRWRWLPRALDGHDYGMKSSANVRIRVVKVAEQES